MVSPEATSMPPQQQQQQQQQIPIIDISPFLAGQHRHQHGELDDHQAAAAAAAVVAQAWDDAFCSVGFAIIVGHGVPVDLITKFRQLANQFFVQDDSIKMQYQRGKYGDPTGGYYAIGHEVVSRSRDAMGSDGGTTATVGAGTTSTNRDDKVLGEEDQHEAGPASPAAPARPSPPVAAPVVDLVESFILRPEQIENDPRPLADVAILYRQEMLRVLQCLHELSAMALGLDRTFFDAYYNATPQHALRLGYYPAVVTDPSPQDNVMRYGEHTDYTGFTILLQDENDHGVGDEVTGDSVIGGGLEVKLPNGTFYPVRAVPHSFVVNIGDMFQVWTNDRWKSTVHRVSAPRRACGSRLSIPFFTGPNHDALIAPILFQPGETAKHETITAGEHYWKKLKATQT